MRLILKQKRRDQRRKHKEKAGCNESFLEPYWDGTWGDCILCANCYEKFADIFLEPEEVNIDREAFANCVRLR